NALVRARSRRSRRKASAALSRAPISASTSAIGPVWRMRTAMADRASQNPVARGRPSRASNRTVAPFSSRVAGAMASRKTQGWPSWIARARSLASVTVGRELLKRDMILFRRGSAMSTKWAAIGLLLCLQAAQNRVPLTEMGAKDAYKGEDGGLYGDGKNEPPAAHAAAAKAEAEKIQPVDGEGKPSKTGKVVLLSIGMSNTTQEFSRFLQLQGARRGDGSTLAIVDGAQGGQAAAQWNTPEARPWSEAERRLGAAGVTPQQVQIVWIKQALIRQGQFGAFPAHAKKLQEEMKKIVLIARAKYPNLRIAYLSSLIYAGYAKSELNPEPY